METFLWWFGLVTMLYSIWAFALRSLRLVAGVILMEWEHPRNKDVQVTDEELFRQEIRAGISWWSIAAGAVLMVVFG